MAVIGFNASMRIALIIALAVSLSHSMATWAKSSPTHEWTEPRFHMQGGGSNGAGVAAILVVGALMILLYEEIEEWFSGPPDDEAP